VNDIRLVKLSFSLLWTEKSLLDRSEVQGGPEGEMCFRAQRGVPAGMKVARLQFALL
jgi:hypothetical protein